MPHLVILWQGFEKTVFIFEISALKFVLMQILQKNKNV